MGPGSGNFGYNGNRNTYQSGNNPYWSAGREHWQYPKGPRRPNNGEGCLKGCLTGVIGAVFGILCIPLLLIAGIVLLLFGNAFINGELNTLGSILFVSILLAAIGAVIFLIRRKKYKAAQTEQSDDKQEEQT